MTNIVAVYGTLKKNNRANHMLMEANFLGEAVTKDKFYMSDVGFPMIKPNKNGAPVKVELYENPNWERLDAYEGVPNLYTRKVVKVINDGQEVEAYIYITNQLSGGKVQPKHGCLCWE